MRSVRVLIVADDPLARAGLATLLADLPDIQVAGRISGGDDLEAAVQTHQPDVLLWDMGWRTEQALARLTGAPRDVPTVALVSDAADAVQGWRAGAQGISARDASPERIEACLLAAAAGLNVFDARFRDALVEQAGASGPPLLAGDEPPPLIEELTPRELDVLRLLAEGLPNKTIAQRLDISEHTVKFHVNALLGKLGVGSRTEAVVRATRLGLIFL